MFLADVLGTIVSPVQHAALEAQRLLLVRPLTPRGRASGLTRIAIDHAQAGPGDRVLVIDEGNAARTVLAAPGSGSDAADGVGDAGGGGCADRLSAESLPGG